jgi:hypothetical protein
MNYKYSFLFICTLILVSTVTLANEFIVKGFKHEPMNMKARTNERLDDNDQPCALILVRTSLIDLGITANSGVVGDIAFKEGDYWVYVSQGTQRVSFFKKGFERKDYDLPQQVRSSETYVLSLSYKVTAAPGQTNTMGFVLIKSDPEEADVWVDGEATGLKTPFQQAYNEGYYTFSLKKELFHDHQGEFTIQPGETQTMEISLQPNHGSLSISTSPEQGASITVDNKEYGEKSPATINQLSPGEHTVTLYLPMYQPITQTVNIQEGETSQFNMTLSPTFGTVKVTTSPPADIYIDQQLKGNGSWEGRVLKGNHIIEAKLGKYYPQQQAIELSAGETKEFNLSLEPKTGILSAMTTPPEAKIYLDDKVYGTTPKYHKTK